MTINKNKLTNIYFFELKKTPLSELTGAQFKKKIKTLEQFF